MVSINRFERKKGLPLALRCLAEVQSREAKATAAAAAAATAAASAASSAPVVAAAPKSSLVKAAPAAQSPAKGGAARTAPPAAPAPPRPPLHLVLAGGYDPRLADSVAVLEELKAEAAVLGVAASVTFAPNVSDTAKAALLREATLLLYTPQGEHFGMVPLEAMAAGRPVVAADSGGPTESVLHATTGFLARPTPAAFADAAQRLLDNPTGSCLLPTALFCFRLVLFTSGSPPRSGAGGGAGGAAARGGALQPHRVWGAAGNGLAGACGRQGGRACLTRRYSEAQ